MDFEFLGDVSRLLLADRRRYAKAAGVFRQLTHKKSNLISITGSDEHKSSNIFENHDNVKSL